jgi:putative transposase
MEELCGFEVASGQVPNLNKQLDAEFQKWRTRPLPPIAYRTLDAIYYKVRIDGVVRDSATLIAYGIKREDGKSIFIGVSCALSEAEVHWRNFLSTLKLRGIGIPDLVTSDAYKGLKVALKVTLSGTPWQRCQFHPTGSECGGNDSSKSASAHQRQATALVLSSSNIHHLLG